MTASAGGSWEASRSVAPRTPGRAAYLDTYKQSAQASSHAGPGRMSRVYMACLLKTPVGLWGVVCGGQIRLLRDGDRIVFRHLHERRSDAAKST